MKRYKAEFKQMSSRKYAYCSSQVIQWMWQASAFY